MARARATSSGQRWIAIDGGYSSFRLQAEPVCSTVHAVRSALGPVSIALLVAAQQGCVNSPLPDQQIVATHGLRLRYPASLTKSAQRPPVAGHRLLSCPDPQAIDYQRRMVATNPPLSGATLEVVVTTAPKSADLELLSRLRRLDRARVLAEQPVELAQYGGHRWLQTRYQLARDSQVHYGVEFSTVADGRMYTVSITGKNSMVHGLAHRIMGSAELSKSADRQLGTEWKQAADRGITDARVVLLLALGCSAEGIAIAGQGSGIRLAAFAEILTNKHVVRPRGRIAPLLAVVEASANRRWEIWCFAKASREHKTLDLAKASCERDPYGAFMPPAARPGFQLDSATRNQPWPEGTRLWLRGFRSGVAQRYPTEAVHFPGTLLGLDKTSGMVRTDLPIGAGMSGSAVVDEQGHLFGIAAAYRERSRGVQGQRQPLGRIGLVIPLEVATSWLAE